MPVASNAKSTPRPPVRSRTAWTGSTAEASTTSVAPNVVAHPSLVEAMSIAIRRSAPAILAPCIAARPMPPRPITATVAPGQTFAVWIAAPTPVDTPQPRRHALSSGMPSGSGMACAACTTVCVASVPHARTPESGAPSRARRSRGGWAQACEHRRGSPRMHDRHVPHGTAHDRTTRSPTRSPRRPEPILLDDPRAFVAEQHRERHAPVPVVARPEVAVTHAARHDPHLDLTGLRFVDLDRLDDDPAPRLVDDGPDASADHVAPGRSRRGSLYCPAWTLGPYATSPLAATTTFVGGAGGDGERRLRLVHAGRRERDRRHV